MTCRCHAPLDVGANEGAEYQPAPVLLPLQGQNPQGDITDHVPLRKTLPIVGNQTNALVTAKGGRKKTRASFFPPAQSHVGESVPPASAPTTIHIQSAKAESCGTARSEHPGRTNREASYPQTEPRCVSTGISPRAVNSHFTASVTDALGAGSQTTEPRLVPEQKRLKATSPYTPDVWQAQLTRLGLLHRYPSIVEGLKSGFSLGIPVINNTYTPPNHQSISRDPILSEVYNFTIANEFELGRYVGPFTRAQLEAELGPFQTSPLSFVSKASKPGKYRAVHNFSFPHSPSPEAVSINSHINSGDFPCTWGTFATVALLIARLPPGSQASVRDVAEAYRTIPTNPAQWPGLVIRLQSEDQFAVNVCNNFRLSSAGGVYGTVADAGVDIFCGNGMGPISKWVDDHIFFRIPRQHLPAYNSSRAQWSHEIQLHGGRQQEGGRLWYKGKDLPSGHPEEFDEDCEMPFLDLAEASPCSTEAEAFTYADSDIDALSERLGIRWESSKSLEGRQRELPIPQTTASTPETPAPYPRNLTPAPSPRRPHCLAKDRLRLWAPPHGTPPSPGTSDQSQCERVKDTMIHAWEEDTREAYGAGLLMWHCFCDDRQIPEQERAPASQALISSFVAHMAAAYSGKTISNYLYGVRAWHILHSIPWHLEKGGMDTMLRAADKLTPVSAKRKKRQPYTPDFIRAIKQQMNLSDPLDAAVFACLTTCFYASARLGEFTVRTLKCFDPNAHVTTRNLSYEQDRNGLKVTVLHLPRTKMAGNEGEDVYWASQEGDSDPTAALQNHLRINQPSEASHLFSYQANRTHKPLTKSKFLERVGTAARAAGLKPLQGHGIRIGSTLEYLLRGVPFDVMKAKGRWAGDSFLLYLRKHAVIIAPYIQAKPVIHESFIRYTMPPAR